MIVKKQNFLNLQNKLKNINFNNDNLENSLKEQFSRLFQLDSFDENEFLSFVKQENQEMIQKNIEIHRDYSNNIELINKSFKLLLTKTTKNLKNLLIIPKKRLVNY